MNISSVLKRLIRWKRPDVFGGVERLYKKIKNFRFILQTWSILGDC